MDLNDRASFAVNLYIEKKIDEARKNGDQLLADCYIEIREMEKSRFTSGGFGSLNTYGPVIAQREMSMRLKEIDKNAQELKMKKLEEL